MRFTENDLSKILDGHTATQAPGDDSQRSRHNDLRSLLWKLAAVLQPQEAYDVALALGLRWCMKGRESEIERLVRDTYQKRRKPTEKKVEFSDLAPVLNPDIEKTKWLVRDMIPESSNVLLGAEKKTGKSLLLYLAMVQAVRGEPVFGLFDVKPGLRVQIWQFEMPEVISLRRLRKACIGIGVDPNWLLEHDRMRLVSQPDLDLCDPVDLDLFHRAVFDGKADLVLLDSIGEAFSQMDPNSNQDVRRFLKPALNPLTKAGVSTIPIHHKRKGQQNGKPDDESDAILGAQSFQAKASRIYSLVRVGAENTPGHFVTRLRSLRGWDMTETPETHLQVRDVTTDHGLGTTVTAMDQGAIREAGVETEQQRAARLICETVGDLTQRRKRKDLLEYVQDEYGVAPATAGRAYGEAMKARKIRRADDGSVVIGPAWEPL